MSPASSRSSSVNRDLEDPLDQIPIVKKVQEVKKFVKTTRAACEGTVQPLDAGSTQKAKTAVGV